MLSLNSFSSKTNISGQDPALQPGNCGDTTEMIDMMEKGLLLQEGIKYDKAVITSSSSLGGILPTKFTLSSKIGWILMGCGILYMVSNLNCFTTVGAPVAEGGVKLTATGLSVGNQIQKNLLYPRLIICHLIDRLQES